jgi:error-prone DNA polymerase
MARRTRYVPLWVKSNHSFLEGASHPDELTRRVAELGLAGFALTDRDGVYGVVKAHVQAKECGVRVIVGSELSVTALEGPALEVAMLEGKVQSSSVIALAQSRAGYANLSRLVSKGRMRSPKGRCLIGLSELLEASSGIHVLCAQPALLGPLRAAFEGRLHALIARHRGEDEARLERALRAAARRAEVPLIASTEVLYHEVSRRPLSDVLTCIRHGTTLSKAGTRIRANSEHALRSWEQMAELFSGEEELVSRSLDVAESCTFSLDQLDYRYPTYSNGVSEQSRLEQLVYEGARLRYPLGITLAAQELLERELGVISDLQFGGYFLTMHEIVQFCRARGILCQGRGSAANSVVCYCLGITAVDPVSMKLLFERFLSRERAEPPDIDLDIEHERREEVIQWVYERYGRRHAAMVANLIRYRARSAVRDVGKVLEIPETELDGIARLLGHYDDGFEASTLIAAGLDPERPVFSRLMQLCSEIRDFPRHLSIHPGGFILGHAPVDELVPIEPATMEGRTVIQWDKYDIEALCLFKVDLLGLGALSAIRRTLALLEEHKSITLEMASIPHEDPDTYDMISRGDTVGVFQIESRAQMSMLPRLKPRTFYDLVIEVAIVRPGPIQGDMVHPYLRRRAGRERVEFPHPDLEEVLGRTLGVPIFQEQVMKVAVMVAGYSPGEADQLRRDMAAWKSSGKIERHRERLIAGMLNHGIPMEFAERVFSQIRGFGEYGFPESHAMSFALLTYVTSWLRCHHHDAFVCGMLNSQPMGFYSASTLVSDAMRRGVEVRAIDILTSDWDCTLEPSRTSRSGYALRMGLRYVKGLGVLERAALGEASTRRGLDSIESFVRAHRLSTAALVSLSEAGAFDSMKVGRRDAIWRIRASNPGAADALESSPLSSVEFAHLQRAEEVLWDHRASEHSARGHPMAALRAQLMSRKIVGSRTVRQARDGRAVDCAGLVICRQRPGTASGVVFFTLEDEDGFINVVVWSDTFERFKLLARTATLLGVRGRVQVSEGVVHVVAEVLYVPELDAGLSQHRSRDFH